MENRDTVKQRLLSVVLKRGGIWKIVTLSSKGCCVWFEEGWNMENRNTFKQRLLCMVLKRDGIWKIVKLLSRGFCVWF